MIGWTSTGDPMEHVARSSLTFDTKETAVAFAEKQGFEAVVRTSISVAKQHCCCNDWGSQVLRCTHDHQCARVSWGLATAGAGTKHAAARSIEAFCRLRRQLQVSLLLTHCASQSPKASCKAKG